MARIVSVEYQGSKTKSELYLKMWLSMEVKRVVNKEEMESKDNSVSGSVFFSYFIVIGLVGFCH